MKVNVALVIAKIRKAEFKLAFSNPKARPTEKLSKLTVIAKINNDKIGFGVRILSAIESGHTEYYYKAVKFLQDELKEQLEERNKALKEIKKEKAKVAEEIANDMYEKTKKEMEKKFGIKIDGTLEKILKEKTIELVNHKMDKDILEEIGIDFDDI